jgi:hypothetical protein
MDRLDRSIGICRLALNDRRNVAAFEFPYDDPECFHGTVASACICGSTLPDIDATRAGAWGVSAAKKSNHKFTQMHADRCNKPGRQNIGGNGDVSVNGIMSDGDDRAF